MPHREQLSRHDEVVTLRRIVLGEQLVLRRQFLARRYRRVHFLPAIVRILRERAWSARTPGNYDIVGLAQRAVVRVGRSVTQRAGLHPIPHTLGCLLTSSDPVVGGAPCSQPEQTWGRPSRPVQLIGSRLGNNAPAGQKTSAVWLVHSASLIGRSAYLYLYCGHVSSI